MSALHVRRALVIGGLIAVAIAGVASAAKPVKGATYSGTIKISGSLTAPISFTVSSSGKKVSSFTTGQIPFGCQGAQPSFKSGGATVSKKGKFTAKLTMFFPPTQPSRTVGTLTITGKFAKHGKESGKLTSTFTGKNGYKASCGKTASYSTKG
jgi:hypothetical protein